MFFFFHFFGKIERDGRLLSKYYYPEEQAWEKAMKKFISTLLISTLLTVCFSSYSFGIDLVKKLLEFGSCPKCVLSGVDLKTAYLKWADLSGADLSRADLSGANLAEAQLVNVNLNNAIMVSANLNEANLRDRKSVV